MSQNDYDVTTNAIVSNNLAFIYILFFFLVSWSRILPLRVKNICEGKSCTGVKKQILWNKKMKN